MSEKAIPPELTTNSIDKDSRVSTNNHEGLLRNIITVNFFYRFFSSSFMFLIPLYAIEKGWTDEFYGLVISIGGYAAMSVLLLLGMIVDVQFKKTTMIIGTILTVVSAFIFVRATNTIDTIVFYSFYSIGQQLNMLSTNTFIANETKKGKHRTGGFSYNMIFRGIAQTIAPIICGYLLALQAIDYDMVFTIMAEFGLVSLILMFVLRLAAEETPQDEIRYAEQLSEDSGDDFTELENEKSNRRIGNLLGVQLSFGLGRMLMGFTSGVAIPFVSRYILLEFNPSDELWGWINSISFLVLTLGYFFMVLIAERVGKEFIVVIFWTLVIPCAVGIMLAKTLFWVSFFFIIRSFFAMTPSAAWNSFLFEWIPPRHRGKTLGALQTAQRGMRATGTLVGGLAFGALGATLFPIMMVAYPIAGLLPLIQSRVVKRRLKQEKIKLKHKSSIKAGTQTK